jgi:hypothetical protein
LQWGAVRHGLSPCQRPEIVSPAGLCMIMRIHVKETMETSSKYQADGPHRRSDIIINDEEQLITDLALAPDDCYLKKNVHACPTLNIFKQAGIPGYLGTAIIYDFHAFNLSKGEVISNQQIPPKTTSRNFSNISCSCEKQTLAVQDLHFPSMQDAGVLRGQVYDL